MTPSTHVDSRNLTQPRGTTLGAVALRRVQVRAWYLPIRAAFGGSNWEVQKAFKPGTIRRRKVPSGGVWYSDGQFAYYGRGDHRPDPALVAAIDAHPLCRGTAFIYNASLWQVCGQSGADPIWRARFFRELSTWLRGTIFEREPARGPDAGYRRRRLLAKDALDLARPLNLESLACSIALAREAQANHDASTYAIAVRASLTLSLVLSVRGPLTFVSSEWWLFLRSHILTGCRRSRLQIPRSIEARISVLDSLCRFLERHELLDPKDELRRRRLCWHALTSGLTLFAQEIRRALSDHHAPSVRESRAAITLLLNDELAPVGRLRLDQLLWIRQRFDARTNAQKRLRAQHSAIDVESINAQVQEVVAPFLQKQRTRKAQR